MNRNLIPSRIAFAAALAALQMSSANAQTAPAAAEHSLRDAGRDICSGFSEGWRIACRPACGVCNRPTL